MALTFARRTLGAVVLAVACCVLPAAARAEAADAGQRAFDRGDFAEALRVWQQRANAGDPHAQLGMGALYDLGRGVAQDATAAFGWYMRAARQGLPEAEINVAVMLDSGRGTPHDAEQAALWYARAMLRGNHRAEYDLAALYASGEGVPRNLGTAVALYRAAQGGGLTAATARLKTLQPIAPSAGVAAQSLTAATPLAPSGDVTPGNAPELVWSTPEQPLPVLYFVEVVGLDADGWHNVFTSYADLPAALADLPAGPGTYAWRVYTVARNTLHYAASPWTGFRVQAESSAPGPE
ncbi:MAG: sel1 repeat family protein [Acetobacteraceae bacterium]|nr:sel1 repeat family protein [Acetobacteraceae bacterium]